MAKHDSASWRMVITTALVGAFIGVWLYTQLPVRILWSAAGAVVLGLLATLLPPKK